MLLRMINAKVVVQDYRDHTGWLNVIETGYDQYSTEPCICNHIDYDGQIKQTISHTRLVIGLNMGEIGADLDMIVFGFGFSEDTWNWYVNLVFAIQKVCYDTC